MFEPLMETKTKMEYIYTSVFDTSEIEMFKGIAKYLLQYAKDTLENQMRNKGKDYVVISLSLDVVRQQLQFDYSKYNSMGVKRELKNLAREEKLELYTIDEDHVYITF